MTAMKDYYKGKPLIFSYESIYEECDNMQQRERRRNLYLRLGFHETGWFAKMNGTEFILASSEENFDKDSFVEFFTAMATPGMKVPELYRRDTK